MKTLPEILTTNGYIKSHLFKVKGAADLWQAEITMQLTEEATSAIAKELMGCLPENIDAEAWVSPETDEMRRRQNFGNRQRAIGHNEALDEVRARLTAFIGHKEK